MSWSDVRLSRSDDGGQCKLCVRVKCTPLRFLAISLRILARLQSFCPFSVSTDHETTFAFGISQKYFHRKKCELKTFSLPNSIHKFSLSGDYNIFLRKTFWKFYFLKSWVTSKYEHLIFFCNDRNTYSELYIHVS